jgi:hypothetical protein
MKPSPSAADQRRAALFALAPAAVLLAFLWPILVGRETWFLRDLFNYHLGSKAVQARAMRDGFLPLIDPFRAGGQAMVGNLNNVALYPDNLLYLLAPANWALNAHLWLHLLFAPLAVYWLARAWGLEREAAWIAGFCYALSGYCLSQLNLYNLIAGAALAPAFAAACIAALVGKRPALAAAGAGAAWALLLVAGDPIFAALALFLGVAAAVASGGRDARRLIALGLALAFGTVMAAPQIVELARVMPSSYRGSLGLSTDSRLVASWDPRTMVELVVPFFFGPPDLRYWGEIVLGSAKPLFFSLYPGLVPAALLLASGRPRSRASRWAWSMVLIGGFLALGGWNPLMFYLYRLPQAASLRYPIKAWLLVAIGAAMLAGIGFERTVLRGSRRRSLLVALAAVGLVAAAAWVAFSLWSGPLVAMLRSRITPAFPATLAVEEVSRWRGALLISLVVVAAAAALTIASRRAPRLAGSILIAVVVAAQLALLQPLLDTDLVAAYRTPPQALSYIHSGERVAHGCPIAFACDLGGPRSYPDWRASWIERRAWLELYSFAGSQFGVRYAYNTSPEGLDTLLVFTGNRALRDLDDRAALRVLAAAGVDVVLLGRSVDDAVRDLVRLRARLPSIAGELWIYEIRNRAAEVRLADRVRGGDPRRVVHEILAADFDPARDAFVPGRPEMRMDGGGETVIRSEGWERLRVGTASGADGLLVLGRAWLPLYRATLDGAPVGTLQANLGQLAVPVPAGSHEVEIWVDRRPFAIALWGTLAGALGLCVLALRGGRRERARGGACQAPVRGGESPVSAGSGASSPSM